MTMVHRRSPRRRVLLAIATGVLGAALAIGAALGGTSHGASAVSRHHVEADIISWDITSS
ncbi:MAG TPA: hypothetical protein VMU95_32180 [Trebonia sp.]|nr:hypothetical protein [Trebonia sp.]